MTKVFIDGSEGTTGLRIDERFQARNDVEILKIDSEKRKDTEERKKLINASDVTLIPPPLTGRRRPGLTAFRSCPRNIGRGFGAGSGSQCLAAMPLALFLWYILW